MSEQLSLLKTWNSKDDWDFAKANTQAHVHGIHPYPARMIPQIASKLLHLYVAESESVTPRVLDPFCGCGTVLVESVCRGYPATGVDINPFAMLLSKVKTLSDSSFVGFLEAKRIINKRLDSSPDIKGDYFVPPYPNIEHWFKKSVIQKLSYIHDLIHGEFVTEVREILQIGFARAVMLSSNVNWKSSRYIRIYPKELLERHKPNVVLIFKGALMDIEKRLSQFLRLRKASADVVCADTRNLPLPDRFADLIITSPPYGEERNTIPYIRWSKLFLLWLGFRSEQIRDIEKTELGGNNKIKIKRAMVPSPTFWNVVNGTSQDRVNESARFLVDYKMTLEQMHRVLKDNGKFCIVIGNRAINRKYVDMGKITLELAETEGFKRVTHYSRKIPNKLIPWTGPTGDTIADESIIVFEKI